jgi:hypothetical protein
MSPYRWLLKELYGRDESNRSHFLMFQNIRATVMKCSGMMLCFTDKTTALINLVMRLRGLKSLDLTSCVYHNAIYDVTQGNNDLERFVCNDVIIGKTRIDLFIVKCPNLKSIIVSETDIYDYRRFTNLRELRTEIQGGDVSEVYILPSITTLDIPFDLQRYDIESYVNLKRLVCKNPIDYFDPAIFKLNKLTSLSLGSDDTLDNEEVLKHFTVKNLSQLNNLTEFGLDLVKLTPEVGQWLRQYNQITHLCIIDDLSDELDELLRDSQLLNQLLSLSVTVYSNEQIENIGLHGKNLNHLEMLYLSDVNLQIKQLPSHLKSLKLESRFGLSYSTIPASLETLKLTESETYDDLVQAIAQQNTTISHLELFTSYMNANATLLDETVNSLLKMRSLTYLHLHCNSAPSYELLSQNDTLETLWITTRNRNMILNADELFEATEHIPHFDLFSINSA